MGDQTYWTPLSYLSERKLAPLGRMSSRQDLAGISLSIGDDTPEGVDRVVLEHDRPTLIRGLGPDAALALQRPQRLDIVAP